MKKKRKEKRRKKGKEMGKEKKKKELEDKVKRKKRKEKKKRKKKKKEKVKNKGERGRWQFVKIGIFEWNLIQKLKIPFLEFHLQNSKSSAFMICQFILETTWKVDP